MKPYFSIIVIAYNRRKYLPWALRSIQCQSFDDYELIVVKNFNDEVSDKLIKELNGINIYSNIMSIGYKVALGLRNANGEVITILEDDDVWRCNRLSEIYKVFSNNDKVIYFHNNAYAINEKNELIFNEGVYGTNIDENIYAESWHEKADVYKKYSLRTCIWNSAMALRSDFIKRYANLIALFPDSIDILLCILSLLNEGAIVHVRDKLTLFRIHEESSSNINYINDPYQRLMRAVKNSIRHMLAHHELIYLLNNYFKYEREKIGLRLDYDESFVVGSIFSGWGRWGMKQFLNYSSNCRTTRCLGALMLSILSSINSYIAKYFLTLYYYRIKK